MFMLNHHLHKATKLFTLLTKIGIQQSFVTFTTAPQHIVFTTQFMRCFHRGNNLCSCPAKDLGIWVRRRARAIARVSKAVSGSPQQFHAALFLLASQHIDHLRKVIDVLF